MSIQFSPAVQNPGATRPLQATAQSGVQFGAKKDKAADEDTFVASADAAPKADGKLTRAIKHAFSKEGLKRDTYWAIAFSVFGMIAPGSQFALIPGAYAIGTTLRFCEGFFSKDA